MKHFFLLFTFYFLLFNSHAQEPSVLMKQVQVKMEKINDYEADARLKTEISFLKVPDALVKIYYKKPNKIKIKNENGISLVPKETVSISLYSLVNSPYQALDAGSDMIGIGGHRLTPILRLTGFLPTGRASNQALPLSSKPRALTCVAKRLASPSHASGLSC